MDDVKPLWRDMDDATRSAEYSPSSALPDGDLTPFVRAYAEKSKAAYAAFPDVQTLPYWSNASNTIDLVMPDKTPAPCYVFIHGGYWQQLSKRDSFFSAPEVLAQNIGFAAIDYTLAPYASLDEIVMECVAAVMKLFEDAESLGIDPTRIVLSGSSAGAHLVAMVCLKLPTKYRPKGVALLSGIYDLEPLLNTYVNDALNMDIATAYRNSPVRQDLSDFPPAIITWGAQETDEFKRQSRAFAQGLANAEVFEIPGRNHFDIVFDLANNSKLGRVMFALAVG